MYIKVIRDEHMTISALLTSILSMIRIGPKDDAGQFFSTLRAMLFYLDEYPAKVHHPKESEFVFAPLTARSDKLAELIGQLEEEHTREESAVRELHHLLSAWEILGDTRSEPFVSRAQRYVEFYRAHMRAEESHVIPEAQTVLSLEEQQRLDTTFSQNNDPLSQATAGHPLYERLFARIVSKAPAPIGLG
jgi:hemerythrin-like domain-containing protein